MNTQASGHEDPRLSDDSIPLLTDRLGLPGTGSDLPKAGSLQSSASIGVPAITPAPGSSPQALANIHREDAHTQQADPHTQRIDAGIAARLESRVTARMLAQAGPLLEAAIESTVPNLLERLTLQLSDDLHASIAQIIREVVTQAVAEELALLQAREPHSSSADQPAPQPPSAP